MFLKTKKSNKCSTTTTAQYNGYCIYLYKGTTIDKILIIDNTKITTY